MNSLSIHDHWLLQFSVDAERRRIVFRTKLPESAVALEVLFDNVLAYHFEHDNFETILFGIEEIPVEDIVRENAAILSRGVAFGWPGTWNTSLEAATAHLRSQNAKGFEVSSSMGLCGWVIARSCRIQRATRAPSA